MRACVCGCGCMRVSVCWCVWVGVGVGASAWAVVPPLWWVVPGARGEGAGPGGVGECRGLRAQHRTGGGRQQAPMQAGKIWPGATNGPPWTALVFDRQQNAVPGPQRMGRGGRGVARLVGRQVTKKVAPFLILKQ